MTAITSHQSPFDAIRQVALDGSEYWSARDLMEPLGYDRWENFSQAIYRAMLAARNQGMDADDLFRGITKKGGGRPQQDYELTRHAAYLVAMNGDPRKMEIADAQAYFAIQTRVAETRPVAPVLTEDQIVHQALQITARKVQELEAKVAEDAPKVGYVDAYVADADLLTLRTVAGSLDVQEKWLRDLLLRAKWIYFDSMTRWSEKKQEKVEVRRYSAYAEKKPYFTPVPVHEAPRFKGEVMHTLKVTPSGAEAIVRLVGRRTRELEKEG